VRLRSLSQTWPGLRCRGLHSQTQLRYLHLQALRRICGRSPGFHPLLEIEKELARQRQLSALKKGGKPFWSSVNFHPFPPPFMGGLSG